METPPSPKIGLYFTSVLLRDAPYVLIAAKNGKFRVTEMVPIGPLKIFDSRSQREPLTCCFPKGSVSSFLLETNTAAP